MLSSKNDKNLSSLLISFFSLIVGVKIVFILTCLLVETKGMNLHVCILGALLR